MTSHRARSLADTFYRHFYCTPSLIAAEVGDTNRGGSNGSVLSQTLSLYFSLFLSPSLSFSPSLPLFFSPALSVSFCFALFPALSLFVWKHGASEGYLVKYPQRCSHIKNRVRQKNSLCICREETDFHYADVNDHLASFIVNRSQQFRLFFFFFIISHLIAAHLITRRERRERKS